MDGTIKSKINTWLVYKILCTVKWIFTAIIQDGLKRIAVTIEEHFADKRLGIETSSFTSFEDVPSAFAFGANKDGRKYQPTYYKKLKKCVAFLKLQESDVFIDIGAGKGRTICYVSQFNLKKVIGIEFLKELVNIARENVAHLKGKHCPVDIVEGDAASADLSEGTIFFLYNPFGPETLASVLNNIKESLKANPRKVRIVYINGVHIDLFYKQNWLEKEGVICNPEDTIWRNKI